MNKISGVVKKHFVKMRKSPKIFLYSIAFFLLSFDLGIGANLPRPGEIPVNPRFSSLVTSNPRIGIALRKNQESELSATLSLALIFYLKESVFKYSIDKFSPEILTFPILEEDKNGEILGHALIKKSGSEKTLNLMVWGEIDEFIDNYYFSLHLTIPGFLKLDTGYKELAQINFQTIQLPDKYVDNLKESYSFTENPYPKAPPALQKLINFTSGLILLSRGDPKGVFHAMREYRKEKNYENKNILASASVAEGFGEQIYLPQPLLYSSGQGQKYVLAILNQEIHKDSIQIETNTIKRFNQAHQISPHLEAARVASNESNFYVQMRIKTIESLDYMAHSHSEKEPSALQQRTWGFFAVTKERIPKWGNYTQATDPRLARKFNKCKIEGNFMICPKIEW